MKLLHTVCCLVLAAGAGCSSFKQAAYDLPGVGRLVRSSGAYTVEVGEPFVLGVSDRPLPHGHYSFPKIRKLPDGTLLVAWMTGDDVARGRWFSIDKDGKFSFSRVDIKSPVVLESDNQWVARLPEPYASAGGGFPRLTQMNLNLAVPNPIFGWTSLSDGSIIGFDRLVWVLSRASEEDLKEYQAVTYGMRVGPDGTSEGLFDVLFKISDLDRTANAWAVYITDRGVELADGSILVAVSSIHIFPYKLEGSRGYASFLYRSEDGGKTFELYSVVASAKHTRDAFDGPSEPGFARLANGDLMVVMRTGGLGAGDRIKLSQPMLMARSQDEGKTWSRTRMSRAGVHPSIYTMENGAVALAYGRPGNRLALSDDHGHSWFQTIPLSPDDQPTSGYIDVMEIEPGKLLVVYDVREYEPPGEKLWAASQGYNAVLGRYITVTPKSQQP